MDWRALRVGEQTNETIFICKWFETVCTRICIYLFIVIFIALLNEYFGFV